MIVDAHCHAGGGDGFTGPWDTRATLAPYLRRARAAGIGRTIVFAAFAADNVAANAEVARLCEKHAPRLTGFAFVHARRDEGRVGELVEEAVRRHGFRGIKVHGNDAPITREILHTARRFGLPVLYDVVGKTEVLDMIAPEYPEVDLIVPHLGSFADDWRAHQRLIDQMCRLPNLFTDTAGVRRFDYLVQALRRVGPERIIFGSDGPWLHPGLELQKIRLLGLSAAAESLVLGANIRRLLAKRRPPARRFGWVPRLERDFARGARLMEYVRYGPPCHDRAHRIYAASVSRRPSAR